MGGSSVPSSTTQTTMLDPTRQAALKKSMGYFDKWADTYKGPTYKGPLTAGRTSDWYAAQNMAHKMANRFSEGGITSVRRFDDGGLTQQQLEDKAVNAGYQGDYTDTAAMQSYIDTPFSYTPDTPSQQPAVTYTYTPSQQQLEDKAVVQGNSFLERDATNLGYQGDYTDTDAMDRYITPANQAARLAADKAAADKAAADKAAEDKAAVQGNSFLERGATNLGYQGDYTDTDAMDRYIDTNNQMDATGLNPDNTKVNVANTGLGSIVDKVNVADTGAGKTYAPSSQQQLEDKAVKDAALQKAITDANLTPANVTPTVTSTNMGSPYLLGQALTLGGAGSAFRLGSDVTPKQIYNSYNTPDKFTPDTWNKAAMDTYMSPYTQGVVDIALREAERQRGIERLRENTAATQSGAFGGYRQGVVEAEGERNYNQSRNDITTKGYQNAYTDAVAQFAADRAAKQAAYSGNQQALQAAATGDISAGQYNQNNKFQAFTNQLNALNQGVSNVQNLSALETAYQNAMGNAGAALTSTDASARASDQATIDALKQLGIDITNVDWTKAQNLSTLAGLSQNNSNVQIKQSN
jgi:hypothetical protein